MFAKSKQLCFFGKKKVNRKCNSQVADDDISVWFQRLSNLYIKLTDQAWLMRWSWALVDPVLQNRFMCTGMIGDLYRWAAWFGYVTWIPWWFGLDTLPLLIHYWTRVFVSVFPQRKQQNTTDKFTCENFWNHGIDESYPPVWNQNSFLQFENLGKSVNSKNSVW